MWRFGLTQWSNDDDDDADIPHRFSWIASSPATRPHLPFTVDGIDYRIDMQNCHVDDVMSSHEERFVPAYQK
jgi:hypothetical protein